MARLYSNGFTTTLDGAISNSDTVITLTSVAGLPAIGSGDTCKLTVTDGVNTEILNCTSVSGNDVTCTRADEGTTANGFADGSLVELRATAESYPTTIGASSAFSAYADSAQSINTGSTTKVSFHTEDFDSNSDYDNSTHEFTPTIAGTYLINANVSLTGLPAGTLMRLMIYKNNSLYRNVQYTSADDAAANDEGLNITDVIDMNGSTDKIDIRVFQGSGGSLNIYRTNKSTWFCGSKIG